MSECPECYNDPEYKLWRDQPMNEEIRAILAPQRYANIFHHTLNDALKAWGEEIDKDDIS